MDELEARRAGRREANLRSLNERIADAQHEAGNGLERLRLVCECALRECEDSLDIPASVFEDARRGEVRYLVAPGHVIHEIEQEVDSGDGWVAVEKFGDAARGAEAAAE